MDGDKSRAKEALLKVVKKRVDKHLPKVQEKAKTKLKNLGVSEDDMRKAAIAAKVGHDISKGEFNYDLGKGFSVKAKVKPKEKMLGLAYKGKF